MYWYIPGIDTPAVAYILRNGRVPGNPQAASSLAGGYIIYRDIYLYIETGAINSADTHLCIYNDYVHLVEVM